MFQAVPRVYSSPTGEEGARIARIIKDCQMRAHANLKNYCVLKSIVKEKAASLLFWEPLCGHGPQTNGHEPKTKGLTAINLGTLEVQVYM